MPRMSGSGRPASSSPFGTSSGGNVTGTVSTLERTPARPGRRPRTTCRRGCDEMLRLRDRDVVEEEARRLAAHHAEIGQVGRRVADEEVVDVVLARVDAGRERRPRRRRLRRVRRRRAGTAPPCSASRFMFGSLPSSIHVADERGIHAVEAEDHEPLRVTGSAGGACGRPKAASRRRRAAIASTAANTATRVDRVRMRGRL